MTQALFFLAVGGILLWLMFWGFRTLPQEGWQILAAVPWKKDGSGCWKGINLTYYGLFTANANVFGIGLTFVLLRSLSIPYSAIFLVVVSLLLLCIPASKIIARIVEKKAHGFTIGGASFVGILAAPWVVREIEAALGPRIGLEMEVMAVLAVLSIAYAFGEGLGRLACISFGCCYGKRLRDCHPAVQRLFSRFCFVFSGETKKLAYAHGLAGEKLVPIQALTCLLCTGVGGVGILLFLHGMFVAAFLATMPTTLGWRIVSEFCRADYRGGGRLSAYQILSAIAFVYSFALPFVFPVSRSMLPDVGLGLRALWSPGMLVFLQLLWLAMFLLTGRSMVTGSTLSFHVIRERV
jgi:hypothetical protein